MALFGSLSTLRVQLVAAPAFVRALDYVARCLTPGSVEAARIAAVPEGATERVELGDGIFALEQAYLGKAEVAAKWEAHERMIDIQVVVSGRERMGVCDVTGLRLTEDYRVERDLMFFAAPESGASMLAVGPGGVAVFYPVDAHMPSLADGDSGVIRKTVVKVPLALVS